MRDALGDWAFVGYMSHSRFDVECLGAIFQARRCSLCRRRRCRSPDLMSRVYTRYVMGRGVDLELAPPVDAVRGD